jgi:tripartite-type tricarboxylate transporter receptor subunit TctC
MTEVNMVHVPYRGGGPVLMELLAGQVQISFIGPVASIGYIRAEKLRPLAVATAARSDALPELPSISDSVAGYEASSWFGIGAPVNTSREIVSKLNKEINAALADPKIKAQLTDLAAIVIPGSPADFGKLIADETEKWGKVIRTANIKSE